MLHTIYFMLNRPEPIRQSSLLMVLASGINDPAVLLTGLDSLAAESQPPWSDRVSHLRVLLSQGRTLSEALSSVERLLPDQTVMAIRMGESAGTLRQVLADEAQRLIRSSESHAATRGGLPMLFCWALVLALNVTFIVWFLMVFIVPKQKKIFEDFDTNLPRMTEALIGVSDWFLSYWPVLILPVLTIIILTLKLLARLANAQLTAGRSPESSYFPRAWTPAILRTLAVATSAQRPLEGSLQAMAAEMEIGRARVRLSESHQRMQAGATCWEALQARGFLTQREATFLQSANTSGHLDWGLIHLSREIDARRGRWLHRLMCAMQPVITLFIGGIVAFVVLGLFLPLVKLINDLS